MRHRDFKQADCVEARYKFLFKLSGIGQKLQITAPRVLPIGVEAEDVSDFAIFPGDRIIMGGEKMTAD